MIFALGLNWAYINGLPVAHGMEMLAQPEEQDEEFTIEMLDELEEMQYVETNPDSVENEPDDTANISDRNQQSAQEDVAGPEQNDAPFLEGDDEESPKIVEGQIPVEGEDAPLLEQVTDQSSNQPQNPQEAQQAVQAMQTTADAGTTRTAGGTKGSAGNTSEYRSTQRA